MKKRVVSLLLCLIMALSLIPTAAFATEVENVEEPTATVETQSGDVALLDRGHGNGNRPGDGGQHETQTTVGHIDIQMALDIPGAQNIELNDADMAALTITATQNGQSVNYTKSSYKLNGSTDDQGRKQVRLNGSFPIGTSEAPVEYTITLTKTVNGTPYTLTLTASFWTYNVCPGKNGIDVAFGKGTSMPQVTITKKIDGVENNDLAANKTFTFKVEDSTGNEVKSSPFTVTTNANNNTASVIAFLPVGTYTVTETTKATYEGYTFDNITSTTSGTLTVDENGGSITITNKYTKDTPTPTTGSLIVEKYVNAAMGTKTPESYNFTLTDANGNKFPFEHADGTISADFSLSVDGEDTYRVEIKDLPIGTYTVTEKDASIKGHTLNVTYQNVDNEPLTPNGDGSISVEIKANETATVHVINEYTQDTQNISVTKVWKDNDNAYKIRPESVTVQLWTTGENPEKVQELTLTADKNWNGEFADVPYTTRLCKEITYEVKEVPVPGYEGEVTGDVDKGFTVTNTPIHRNEEDETILPTLTIKKVDKDTEQPLAGAVFQLKQTFKLNNETNYRVTTGADGLCQIADLTVADAPTYELTEFTAPAGYLNLDTTWTVTITGSPNVTYKVVTDDDGNITGYKEVRQFSIESVADKTDPTKKLSQDSTGAYVVENEKLKDVTVKNLKVTKEVTLAREGITPGTAKFIFKASYADPMSDEYKLVEFNNNTLTITTTGKETKTEAWNLVVPAAAFDEDGDAFIVVEEVNGGLTNWKYDKTQYELAVNQAGEIMFAWKVSANNTSERIPTSDPLKFSNKYDYTYVPPTPRPTPRPTPKPVQSVKTGDMGIAMYAMTSLLSLGGAALVIKKRKDEE